MPKEQSINNFQNSKNSLNGARQAGDNHQKTVAPFQNKIDETSAEAAQGLAITQEQISDVYNAGTSDGILILEGGIIVNLKED